ncbi:uncharacterized protein LOC141855099 [Brevipalpus obovatus]|uniref:uncharacterized protein LOC141855099 n=1 Tax=Brevipalpus obovatus TaxID=246614 RepID=UPI003D9EACD6
MSVLIQSSCLFLLSMLSTTMAQYLMMDRDGSVKAAAANLTNAFNTPYAYYDLERDPRRWFTGPYGSSLLPVNGGVEAIGLGLMIAVGIGFIILPLLMILYSNMNGHGGFGLGSGFNIFNKPMPSFPGRKKRDILQSLFPEIHPQLQEKLSSVFKQFVSAASKFDF